MKKKDALKNVVIYCRESRDDGYANYERIETQRDILIQFCESRQLGKVVDITMDDNLSGTDFSRLNRIKKMIERKEVDIFVCKDASRIGRNLLDSLRFIEFLDTYKVELIFESEQYNEDMFPLIAWFNERRVKDDSSKIRRVLKHKMMTGDLVIKAPFGYKKEGNSLVIHEEAAAIVREIFELYVEGMGSYGIATVMNKKGYPTPSQLKAQYANTNRTAIWNKQHIERIIRHVAYSGDMPYGMREKMSYKSKKYITKEKEDWIIIPNHHEPIVSKEIFDNAQQRIGTHKKYEIRDRQKRVFSGLVFCGRCGNKMYGKTRQGRRTSLVCFKNNVEGSIKDHIKEGYGCKPHRIYEDELITRVKEYMGKFIEDPVFQQDLFIALSKGKQKALLDTDIKRMKRLINDLQDKASHIYEDKLNGMLPEFLFKKKLEEITAELNRNETELNECMQAKLQLENENSVADSVDRIIESIDKNGITNDNLSLLFKKIIVFEPGDLALNHMETYNLTDEEYTYLSENGGILFATNFRRDPT